MKERGWETDEMGCMKSVSDEEKYPRAIGCAIVPKFNFSLKIVFVVGRGFRNSENVLAKQETLGML